jgi:hypothetical protein
LAYFFFGGGDEDDHYGDGGAAAGLSFRPVGSPDFKYSSMACWGVLVEVDLSTWTGGGFGFLPSKTTPAGWFPVARSFRALPDGILVTSLGSFDFPAPCDLFVTFWEGCVFAAPCDLLLTFWEGCAFAAPCDPLLTFWEGCAFAAPCDPLLTFWEGCAFAAPCDPLLTFWEGCAFSAAVAPPTPRTKKNTTANTAIAILLISPPLFKVAPQSQCADFLNIGKFCLEI